MLGILHFCPDISITNFFSIYFENKRKILFFLCDFLDFQWQTENVKIKSLETVYLNFCSIFIKNWANVLETHKSFFFVLSQKMTYVSTCLYLFQILLGEAFFQLILWQNRIIKIDSKTYLLFYCGKCSFRIMEIVVWQNNLC